MYLLFTHLLLCVIYYIIYIIYLCIADRSDFVNWDVGLQHVTITLQPAISRLQLSVSLISFGMRHVFPVLTPSPTRLPPGQLSGLSSAMGQTVNSAHFPMKPHILENEMRQLSQTTPRKAIQLFCLLVEEFKETRFFCVNAHDNI